MRKGFTLIEILVAAAILIIIVLSALAIFRTASSSWQKGQIRTQRYQAARFILERMSKEAASIIPPSLAGPYCQGTAESLYFVCAFKDDRGSLAEVGYRLENSAQGLMRVFESAPDYNYNTFEEEELLSENVSRLNFEYFDGRLWQYDWDSRPEGAQAQTLPKAIKISFELQDPDSLKTESFSSVVTLPAASE